MNRRLKEVLSFSTESVLLTTFAYSDKVRPEEIGCVENFNGGRLQPSAGTFRHLKMDAEKNELNFKAIATPRKILVTETWMAEVEATAQDKFEMIFDRWFCFTHFASLRLRRFRKKEQKHISLLYSPSHEQNYGLRTSCKNSSY